MLTLEVLFWISLLGLLHSYLLFPFTIRLMAGGKKLPAGNWRNHSPALPMVSVVMAAYNEEKAIGATLNSILNSNYPKDKMEVLVGSDNSTDQTNAIVHRLRLGQPMVNLFVFKTRRGKPGILNSLINKKVIGEIVVLCDATVIFHPDAIYNLVRHFSHPEVGVVGAALRSAKTGSGGIANVERAHFSREAQIKHDEGVVFGTSMGMFGALYAIRRSLFRAIPARFTVDDFFLTLHVMRQGYRSLLDIDAIGEEEVSDIPAEEFRRKVRISMGNWQNLWHYRRLLFNRNLGLSYCFWSHKVLRWLGPGLLLTLLITSWILAFARDIYFVVLLIQLMAITAALLDTQLGKASIHLKLLRAINHFYRMNAALGLGFIRWLAGVRSNIWEPTRGSAASAAE